MHSVTKSSSPCAWQEPHSRPVWLRLSYLLDTAGWIHRFFEVGFWLCMLAHGRSRNHQTFSRERMLDHCPAYLEQLSCRRDRGRRGEVSSSPFLRLEVWILICHLHRSPPSANRILKIQRTLWVQVNVFTLKDIRWQCRENESWSLGKAHHLHNAVLTDASKDNFWSPNNRSLHSLFGAKIRILNISIESMP